MNSKYELMVMVDANKSPTEKEEVYRQTQDVITKTGGRVLNTQVWLEKYKMSFSLKKKTEATYYLVTFESEGALLAKMRELLRLNEEILRYLIIRQ